MLRDARFMTVGAKTFLLEHAPPTTDLQHYLSEVLASWRADETLFEEHETTDGLRLSYIYVNKTSRSS